MPIFGYYFISNQLGAQIMTALTDLQAAVAADTALSSQVVTGLQQVVAEIASLNQQIATLNANGANDPAIESAAQTIAANTAAMQAALATLPAPPAPAPAAKPTT